MRIKKEQAQHLAELYERANLSGEIVDWNLIDAFYKKLAREYQFDLNKVSISLQGYVNELKYCFRCKGLATGIEGTDYVRDRIPGTSKWGKFPVCQSCIAKYYPEIHKVDSF